MPYFLAKMTTVFLQTLPNPLITLDEGLNKTISYFVREFNEYILNAPNDSPHDYDSSKVT